ncbi:MAG: Mobile element protein [Nitrospira sp.]|jgi:hypothetical protein|nr:MAG: Mobile element protein [Nitrospira sp.]
MEQSTFAEVSFERYRKPTRRERFLDEMNRVVPWAELMAVIEPVPDETTIGKFRHLLEARQLGEQLFVRIREHLVMQGVQVSRGTIVDATIIAAPSSTKNRQKERDPEMHQPRRGTSGISA